jgi:hypothetical protein
MSMMRHPSRLVPMAVVAVLALGACGSGDDSTAETPPPTAESSDDGMLAPRPIEMSGGGAAAGSATAAPEVATADRSMATDMIAPYQITNFVAGDSLPPLPTNATGWVFQSGATVTAEQVTQLATALGVTGEPQRHDENGYVYWSVGPNDGSAPYVTVNEDAQQSWSYNSAWANQTVSASAGCAIAEPAIAPEPATMDAGAAIDTTAPKPVDPVPCTVETTPPPVGVPTADEAEARTRDLMTAVGLDPANFKLETYADVWYASVNATEQLDGQFGGRSFSTGFGPEGVLQYAGGQLAVPAPVGPYPLVDLDTAIARLNDPSGFYMGGYGGGIALDSATAIATREVTPAGAGGVDVAEADVASVPPATAPTEPPATDGGGSSGSVGGAIAPPISESPISTPVPVSIPTPQEVTVTLVDVQPDVWWVWDIDNTVWLLPAYRFIGDDGGSYTVPAVTDEFLVRVPLSTVPPSSEPVPLPPVTAPTETVPADTVADVTPLESSVGKTFAEFQADAEALGLTARVVERDGVSLPVTMDYNPNRVNVAVTGEGDTAIVTAIVNVG